MVGATEAVATLVVAGFFLVALAALVVLVALVAAPATGANPATISEAAANANILDEYLDW